MRYTLEITIVLPRNKVIELFDNPDNLYHWRDSLVSLKLLSGTQGHKGARTKLIYKLRKHRVEMIETVESRSLPDELVCTYESKNVWNRTINRFIEINTNKTMWVLITEFRCTGLLRIICLLMPGIFRKTSLKDMKEFRRFAESQSLCITPKLHAII